MGQLTADDQFSHVFGDHRGSEREITQTPGASAELFVGDYFFVLYDPDPRNPNPAKALVRMYRQDEAELKPKDRTPLWALTSKTCASRSLAR